jgi:hypothetical protein
MGFMVGKSSAEPSLKLHLLQLEMRVIVPCFAHQYSKRYVMDIIVYCNVNWIPPIYIYTHPNLEPNLNLYWCVKHGTITEMQPLYQDVKICDLAL